MWQNPRIQNLFNIDQPILQAPMAGSSSAALVAAVSNAGGLGSFGAAPLAPAALKDLIQEIRQLTDKPFNINLFATETEQVEPDLQPSEEFAALLRHFHRESELSDTLPGPRKLFGPADEQLAVLIEEKVPVISFHFGVEQHQVEAIHRAGLKVICTATTLAEAKHLDSLGVDAIIAQGSEAGGHRGTYLGDPKQALIGTLALVPQIVDAVSVPVIAAGGIMDGRGIVACAALGASAVQMGTAFLGCKEISLAPAWRLQLSTANPSDTTVTSAVPGKPARGIQNRFISEVELLNEPLLPYPLHYSMSRDLRKKAGETDNSDFLVMWSGQGIGMYRSLPAADLIAELLSEIKSVQTVILDKPD
jgi:nitronate monooxygenase